MLMKILRLILLSVITIIMTLSANAQYNTLNIRQAERYSSTDMNAISVESITPITGDANGYDIKFCDTQNTNRAEEQYATSFEYYLSYKGKRVSDYKKANSNYQHYFTSKCYTWPDAVPKGYEKYVTVQIGREPQKKDRRDDD